MKKVLGTWALALLIGVSALASMGSAACDPGCCPGDDALACAPSCDPAPSCAN